MRMLVMVLVSTAQTPTAPPLYHAHLVLMLLLLMLVGCHWQLPISGARAQRRLQTPERVRPGPHL